MEKAEAITRLQELLGQGELKIITNEHDCGAGKHPTMKPWNPQKCEKYKHPNTDPRHFVIHVVTGLGPARGGAGKKGQWRATTEAGDFCQGQPEALLSRLTEAGKASGGLA